MRRAFGEGTLKRKPQGTALQHAVALLARRSYSERRLREKLAGRGYEAADIGQAIRRLREENLLDDRRYAEDFVRARLTLRPRAASVLARELRQRGIAAKLAQEVAAALAPRESDEELAHDLIRRRASLYSALDETTRRRRLAALLARRGFSYHIIQKVLRFDDAVASEE